MLVDAPLTHVISSLASSLGYEGISTPVELLAVFDPTTLSLEPFIFTGLTETAAGSADK